jgi:lipoate-protein ligase B
MFTDTISNTVNQKQCYVYWLGSVPYLEAWQLQQRWAEEIGRGERAETLLLLEHPHTFTFGQRGQAGHLLWDTAELERQGVAVHWVDRGGDVTYHGPGQLVGYPLLRLAPPQQGKDGDDARDEPPKADYVGYLRRLELVIIQALGALGVTTFQVAGLSGVWVESEIHGRPAKIAAVGVKVDAGGVTRHGFAVNINPEMRYWQGIVACGLKDYPTTSLAELLDPLPCPESVRQAVIQAFGEVFGYQMVLAESS